MPAEDSAPRSTSRVLISATGVSFAPDDFAIARMIVPSWTSAACPRAVLSVPANCSSMSPGIVFQPSARVIARWMVACCPTISPNSPRVTRRSAWLLPRGRRLTGSGSRLPSPAGHSPQARSSRWQARIELPPDAPSLRVEFLGQQFRLALRLGERPSAPVMRAPSRYRNFVAREL